MRYKHIKNTQAVKDTYWSIVVIAAPIHNQFHSIHEARLSVNGIYIVIHFHFILIWVINLY